MTTIIININNNIFQLPSSVMVVNQPILWVRLPTTIANRISVHGGWGGGDVWYNIMAMTLKEQEREANIEFTIVGKITIVSKEDDDEEKSSSKEEDIKQYYYYYH